MSGRLDSIDALRGFDMFFIMGLAALVTSVCAALGHPDCTIAVHMRHVPWVGFHQHDLIFPLFLFLAGCSWPFSLASQLEKGRTRRQIVCKILRRAVTLFLLGCATSKFFAFDFAHVRIGSVIGRIGVAWAVAALCSLFFSRKTCAWMFVTLFFAYWAAFRFLPGITFAPGIADPFSQTVNLNAWFDEWLMPGRRPDRWGTDGVLTTFGAVLTAFLGVFAGQLLRRGDLGGNRKVLVLAAGAAASFVAYFAFEPFCPCIKDLWTSSFVLLAGGWSLTLLAIFYWIIDVRGWKKWSFVFRVVGMNSITIYLAQWCFDFHGPSRYFLSGLAGLAGPKWGGAVIWAGYIACCWIFLYVLYRKKIFLRV